MATAYTPYPYQESCLGKLRHAYRSGKRRALVVMASGLGKTVTLAFFARRTVGRDDRKVLFLCHNNDILEQARRTFEEVIGGPWEQYGYFTGRGKNRHGVKYLFASFQTMRKHREEFAKDEFALVIVDEGHHGPAATYRPTIDYFTPEFLVGMTATPDRMDLLDIRDIYGREVFDLPLDRAIALGYVTDVRYELLADEIVASRLAGLASVETSRGKLLLRDLNRVFAIPRRDAQVVESVRGYLREVAHPRVMIFCPSISYCERLQELMPGSVSVHSKLSTKVRRARLDAFRDGLATTVLTVDVFNEGIDVPEANVIVFLRSTASRTVFLQQLGRGLRKSKGKRRVLVLDFAGNCDRLELVNQLSESVTRIRQSVATLEEVDAPFSFEFAAAPRRILELLSSAREPVTRERLIQDLRDLGRELQRTPTVFDLAAGSKAGRCRSLTRYVREFGSYNDALIAAGFTPQRLQRSRERLLADLQELAERLGRTPTVADVDRECRRSRCASTGVYQKKFGTFGEALKAAGFEPNLVHIRRTDERLIAELRELAEKLGRTPTAEALMAASVGGAYASVAVYSRRFGSFPKALRAAGFTPTRDLPSRESLILSLQELSRRLGRVPTAEDIGRASQAKEVAVCSNTYTKVFGTLAAALEAAGFKPNLRFYTREELIADFRALSEALGRTPTLKDIQEASKAGRCASPGTYRNQFGSLQQAAIASGITPIVKTERTNEQLIADLQQLGRELGRTPTYAELAKASVQGRCASTATYAKRFGTFAEALQAAGFVPNLIRPKRRR